MTINSVDVNRETDVLQLYVRAKVNASAEYRLRFWVKATKTDGRAWISRFLQVGEN